MFCPVVFCKLECIIKNTLSKTNFAFVKSIVVFTVIIIFRLPSSIFFVVIGYPKSFAYLTDIESYSYFSIKQ